MKKDPIPDLEAQLAYLAQVSDDQIDCSDIPEIIDWSGAIKGAICGHAPERGRLAEADNNTWGEAIVRNKDTVQVGFSH